jgi:DNA-binding response OmpR family regulator
VEISYDNRKVLIVDDEPDICLLLARKLQKKGFDATYATSLTEGFEKFRTAQPNFLILDHNLPDGYGLANIERFRGMNPNVKVIIISAEVNLGERATKAGADHFTPKPISFKDIEDFLGA